MNYRICTQSVLKSFTVSVEKEVYLICVEYYRLNDFPQMLVLVQAHEQHAKSIKLNTVGEIGHPDHHIARTLSLPATNTLVSVISLLVNETWNEVHKGETRKVLVETYPAPSSTDDILQTTWNRQYED
jgi:hypothetical protein